MKTLRQWKTRKSRNKSRIEITIENQMSKWWSSMASDRKLQVL